MTIVNRASFSAWIGGAGWAGLERGSRYLFTAEAVRRLVATRDQVVKSTRWRPGTGIATMWQTLVNSATFGRNVVVGASVDRRQALAAASRLGGDCSPGDPRPAVVAPFGAGRRQSPAAAAPKPSASSSSSSTEIAPRAGGTRYGCASDG